MQSIARKMREMAQQFFQQRDFGSERETRITLFIQAAKMCNVFVLSKIEMQPFAWEPYKYLHRQLFREMELVTLMNKATSWSTNPYVYAEASNLNLKFWQNADIDGYMQGFFMPDENFYRYLALSHALLSEIRIFPILPPTKELNTPFLSSMKEVEEENGRMIQAQIRLLKGMDLPLTYDEKERIIREQRTIVQAAYCDLLESVLQEDEEEEEQQVDITAKKGNAGKANTARKEK